MNTFSIDNIDFKLDETKDDIEETKPIAQQDGSESNNDNHNADVSTTPNNDGTSDTDIVHDILDLKLENNEDEINPQKAKSTETNKADTPTGTATAKVDADKPTEPNAAPAKKTQDIIDPNTGEVIAKAGIERRWYEQLQNTRTELEAATKELNAYKHNENKLSQLNLNQQELLTSAQFLQSFKTDPLNFTKTLLADLKAKGYTFSEEDQAGINLQAVSSMIDTKLNPLMSDHVQAEAQAKAVEEATKIVNTFYSNYPDAKTHENELYQLLSFDQTLTLEKAYIELVKYATRNQLDFTQPLAPQIQARKTVVNSPTSNPAALNRGNNQPPMNINGVNSQQVVQPKKSLAAPDDSWHNIVQSALRDNGINI